VQFNSERTRSLARRRRQIADFEPAIAQHRVRKVAAALRVAIVELTAFEVAVAQIAAAEAAIVEAAVDKVCASEHRLAKADALESRIAHVQICRVRRPNNRLTDDGVCEAPGRDVDIERSLREWGSFGAVHVLGSARRDP
jgi:hypothetical protein